MLSASNFIFSVASCMLVSSNESHHKNITYDGTVGEILHALSIYLKTEVDTLYPCYISSDGKVMSRFKSFAYQCYINSGRLYIEQSKESSGQASLSKNRFVMEFKGPDDLISKYLAALRSQLKNISDKSVIRLYVFDNKNSLSIYMNFPGCDIEAGQTIYRYEYSGKQWKLIEERTEIY
ncbi:hypothetical protein ICN84_04280 [Akkermansia glycaniphila]|uniref:hypothetical protein n=1 Tax=Akkermansia glycaniphila TaxID=1679444 RepID=UPI001C0119DA|nr:hypothetical protein [Akkermansia glycaniphila]MBT9449291.1 hypothetical protein [Akkermansia glycaniphila]